MSNEIEGSSDNDRIIGTAGDDVIDALEGDDLIIAREGDDIINAGDGDDVVNGGAGNDVIDGGEGNDEIIDFLGNNNVTAGAGDDSVMTGAGVDTIDGGDGDDDLSGGSGDDVVSGDAGEDLLFGGVGDDMVSGGADNDRVHGGDGNDELHGDGGDDNLFGESGDDIIYGGEGDDVASGGDGADTIYGEAGEDRLIGNDGEDELFGGDDNDALFGGLDNDQLHGQGGDDSLFGGAGDDDLLGGEGDDNLRGEAGDDDLFGNLGDDFLAGADGADFLSGGDGDDRLLGQTGDDQLFGDGGADTLIAGTGEDTVDGGSGGDFILAQSGNDTGIFTAAENVGSSNTYDGGSGFDKLVLNLTAAEFFAAEDEINAYLALVQQYNDDPANAPFDHGPIFVFTQFGNPSDRLIVRFWEEVEINITDAGSNQAPVAVADAFSVDQDGVLVDNVLVNDTDPDPLDPISVVQAPLTSDLGVAISVTPEGELTYNPNDVLAGLGAGETATDTFQYTIEDTQGASSQATVSIEVTGVNDAPEITDSIAVSASEVDAPFSVDLLEGAEDVDANDVLTVADLVLLSGDPSGITLQSDGTLLVNPSAYEALEDGESAVVEYTYNIIDGNGGSVAQTASITINGVDVNESPEFSTPEIFVSTDQNVNLISGVAPFASDVNEDDTLEYSIVDSPDPLTVGTVTIDSATGEYTFDPVPGFTGPTNFTIEVTDNNPGTVPAELVVNVSVGANNTAPVLAVVGPLTTDEDVALLNVDVLTGSTDPEGGTLSVVSAEADNGVVAIDAVTGELTYTPNENFNGPDVVSYVLSDGENETTGSFDVAVSAVNDIPVAVAPTLSTLEGQELPVSDAQLLADASDADGDALSVVVGSLTVTDPTQGAFLTSGGVVAFVPAPGLEGGTQVAYSYQVQDDSGDAASDTITVTGVINVGEVNDGPTFTLTAEDALSENQSADDATPPVVATITGLSDEEDGTPTLTLATGSELFAIDGLNIVLAAGVTLDDAEVGAQQITVVATDTSGATSTQTITVEVENVNDAPVAVAPTLSTLEGQELPVSDAQLLADASDADGDDVSVVADSLTVTTPAQGTFMTEDGVTAFVPAVNLAGGTQVEYTYQVTDGVEGSAPVLVTGVINVGEVNDGPTFTLAATDPLSENQSADDETPPVVATITGLSDEEDGTPTLTLTTGSELFALVQDLETGMYTIVLADGVTLDDAEVGSQQITVVATDASGATSTQTITVEVENANDAPTVDAALVGSVEEGNPVGLSVDLLAGANDLDGDDLSVALADDETLPAGVTLDGTTLNVDATDPSFASLGEGETQEIVVNYTISDGNGGSVPQSATITVIGTNGTPTIAPLTLSVTEDVLATPEAPTSIDLLMGVVDDENGPYTVGTVSQLPAGVSLVGTSIEVDTSMFDALAGGEMQEITVTYDVVDAAGAVTPNTLVITVTGVEDAPVTVTGALTVSGEEDGAAISGSVADLFDDVDTEELTYSFAVESEPTGDFTLNALTGEFTYTPGENESGSIDITITASDEGVGDSTVATSVLTINLDEVSDAPVVTAVTIGETDAQEDAPLVLNVFGDEELPLVSDADSTEFSVVSADAGNGSVAIGADGELTYTPNENFNGEETLTYAISDGANVTTTTVTFEVNAVNDAPESTGGDVTLSTEEGTAVAISVAGEFSDVDTGDVDTTETLTYSVAAPVNGTITGLDTATGAFTYTPADEFNGQETIVVTITDAAGATATVNVVVAVGTTNDAPVVTAVTIGETDAQEDAPLVLNVLVDPGTEASLVTDADSTEFSVVSADAGNGSVAIGEDGELTYTPNGDFNGEETLTYAISDGQNVTTTTVTFTVNAVNDAPESTGGDVTLSTEEGTAVAISVAGEFSDVDTGDVDTTETLTYSVAAPVNGTITGLDTATGAFTYTPADEFNGQETIVVTITDAAGATATVNVVVAVGTTNDAPVVTAVTIGETDAQEDAPLVLNVLVDPGTEASLVTDADSTEFSVVSADAGNGSVAIGADGELTYTPNENFNGEETLTYAISDGANVTTTTVTFEVNAVNDAPESTGGDVTLSTEEGTAVAVSVAGEFSDVDVDDTLTYSVAEVQANGTVTGLNTETGEFTYTPTGEFNGQETIVVTATDSANASTSVNVVVAVGTVSDAPVVTAVTIGAMDAQEDAPLVLNVFGNEELPLVSDADSSEFSVVSADAGNGGVAIGADGELTYTPNENFNGEETLTYAISDGANVTTTTVTFDVNAVNDAPVFSDVEINVSTDEGVAVTGSVGPLASDVDDDASALSYSLGVDATIDGTTETLVITDGGDEPVVLETITLDTVTGEYTYTPGENVSGAQSFEITVSDDEAAPGTPGTDTITINVAVGAVNDAPVLAAITAGSIVEDAEVALVLPVLADATDAEGDDLSIVSAEAGNGTVTINDDGTLSYTPDADYFGPETVTYSVTDGANTVTNSVTFTVDAVNDAPVFSDVEINVSTDEGVAVTGSVGPLASDVDDDLNVLTYSLGENIPLDGVIETLEIFDIENNVLLETITLNTVTGEYTYTPGVNVNGAQSFEITVSDDQGATDTVTVNVAVGAVNDAPVLSPPTVADVLEDTPAIIDLLAATAVSDSDNDAADLSVLTATAQNGTVLIKSDGSIVYTPDAEYFGPETISYSVTDGDAVSSAEINFNVAAVNDAPTVNNNAVDAVEDGDALMVDLLAGATDVDGDNVSISAGTVVISVDGVEQPALPAWFALAADGTATFTLNDGSFDDLSEGESREVLVEYDVTDDAPATGSAATASASFVVTVTGTNDGPSATAIANNENNQDSGNFTIDLLSSADDADHAIADLTVAGVSTLPEGLFNRRFYTNC